jgi:hypothetical protein
MGVVIIRKYKNAKIDDYVLASQWGDKDINDPWAIGYIKEILITKNKIYYKVSDSNRYYKNIWKITETEAYQRFELYKLKGWKE